MTTSAKALPGTRVQMAGRKSSVHGGYLLRVQLDSIHPRVCELGCVMVKIYVSVKRYRSSTSSGGQWAMGMRLWKATKAAGSRQGDM